MALSGCSKTPYVWAESIPADRAAPAEDRQKIAAGDSVSIVVKGHPDFSGPQTVGSDGNVILANIGSVGIGGLAPKEAASTISSRLSRLIDSPSVSVSVLSRSVSVTVLGEVNTPGKYVLKSGDGVAAAIALAGGLTEFAKRNSIYLIRSNEPTRIRFRMKDLLRGGNSARAFALRDGDLLTVE